MNPQSAYYLSFNTGFPNAFDRALGRTGSQLMVHGDCSSRGCYAMTDEQISEIYSLGRESFFGGQRAFQFQAYPFRMTPLNMAKHRNNPNMPFWKMIKEGYDHFEVTRQEPKVDFCEKKYVFDADKSPDAKRDPVFNASAKCPAYVIPDEVAEAVRDKQQQEEAETAKLIARGTPVARMNTGIDGGMHRVFAAKLPDGNTGLSEGGDPGPALFTLANAPGTIPPTVNPPRGPVTSPDEPLVASMAPVNAPGPRHGWRPRRRRRAIRWLLQHPCPQGWPRRRRRRHYRDDSQPGPARPPKAEARRNEPRRVRMPRSRKLRRPRPGRPPPVRRSSHRSRTVRPRLPHRKSPASSPARSRSCRPIRSRAVSRR